MTYFPIGYFGLGYFGNGYFPDEAQLGTLIHTTTTGRGDRVTKRAGKA